MHGADPRERKNPGFVDGLDHFRVDMPRLVDSTSRQAASRRPDLGKLKLSEINEGFAAMKAGKMVRSVIMFDA